MKKMHAPPPSDLEAALTEIAKNRRVCPMPKKWDELYQMLQRKQRSSGDESWLPVPLILAAWYDSDHSKRQQLESQLQWASRNGCIAAALTFLRSLPEEDWHHTRG